MFTSEDIAEYYDQCEVHYKQHLKLDKCLAMHYGYWMPDTTSFEEALLNTNRVLAAKASIGETDRVLDAGCGVGGSAVNLARAEGCSVLGITVSDQQVESAKKNAIRYEVDHLADFECRNFCDTGLAPGSFDVVWAVESVCHANDKRAFVEEAYRLLCPGGRLVMADFFSARIPANSEEARVLSGWLDGWAVPGLSTIDAFEGYLNAAGFKTDAVENATENIRPSAKRLYHRFMMGFPIQKLYEWFSNPMEIQKKSVRTAKLQYDALQAGLWAYYVLVAEKN